MAATKIKICGITRSDALEAAIAAHAEFVGFNFFPPSPRHLSARDAAALAERAGSRIGKVGVFVDPDDALLGEVVWAAKLDAIQLHGSETPDRAAQIRARFALPVWKVMSVAAPGDIAKAIHYRTAADFILFDAKTPSGTLPGGMGLAFDWALLSGNHGTAAWGLAGGLTPANVAEAIRTTRTSLVDTSSGVESAPGVKDVDKIAAFCKAVRQC